MNESKDQPRGHRDYSIDALRRVLENRKHRPPSNENRVANSMPAPPDTEAGLQRFVAGLDGQDAPLVFAAWDVAFGLARAFSPAVRDSDVANGRDPYPINELLADRAKVELPFNGRVISESHHIVTWRYTAAHDRPMNGLHATNRIVTFDGVSIFDREMQRVTKYIDWNFVMAQLGLVATQRPLLSAEVDAKGVHRPVSKREH